MVPKRGLDIMGCESARLLKVTNEAGVQPLSFYVPRKSDAFQEDIFPDTASAIPAHSAEEWAAGSSKPPETLSLNPRVAQSNGGGAPKKKFSTVSSLTAELKEAKLRIQQLEEKLAAAGIQCD